ncbi:MAG: glutaconyl-CoA decarboxylase subunit alpha, partial [Lachnospiraceae bacterium]|nr:glutaconyl-CoA decarboxylase subunit alpha [Lachnospiraceae bacterium]
VTLCGRDRIPLIWLQDTTGIDVGDDAERAELLGLGQSLIYSIEANGLPSLQVTLRKASAAAHYVLGGPQGNNTNAYSIGTAACEYYVMPGETAANAMYSRKLVKASKAGEDMTPIIDKMNEMIQLYTDKSRPAYCAKMGMVDEIVDMTELRPYLQAFTEAVYQNPKSICPMHQMVTPRACREFETYKKA